MCCTPSSVPLADAPKVDWQLAVALPNAPQSLDTTRIALELTPQTMDYYANASWQDRAPVIVQRTLLEGFEKSGKIAAVARDTGGMRGDYILQSDLRAFGARYEVPDTAPMVIVDISARLLRTPGREIVATLQARHTAQASVNSVPAVVAAFDQALGETAEQIVAWALAAPPAPDAKKPVSRRRHHRRRHRR